jgi:iron complex transport system substrate-binding protein
MGSEIMKKSLLSFLMIAVLITAAICVSGCTSSSSEATQKSSVDNATTVTITDGYGRSVTIPENPDRIICSGSGCLRYVVYLGEQDKVVGVDSIEKENQTSEARAYAIANPQFASLPLIGEFRGKDDPEKIVAIDPQVIFKTGSATDQPASVIGAADTLQNKTGIPVIAIPYGSLKNTQEQAQMYNSLRLMGSILGNESRADELIRYVNATTQDLESRTGNITASEQKTVYIGGISSSGAHGIISTEPAYPPFIWVHANNIAAGSGTAHADMSKEVIVDADPEYLFIDAGTSQIANGSAIDELSTNAAYSSLSAVKNGKVYGVLPYNFYTTNYESVLADAYFVGKTLYPDRFSDITPETKADEIYTEFVGQPVFAIIKANNGNFGFEKISV